MINFNPNSMRRLLIILAFALIPTTGLLARDFYWKGGTGRWNDPTMWELRTTNNIEGVIPSKTDNVFIDKSNSHIFIDNDVEVENLYWYSGKVSGKPKTKISSYGMIEIGSSVVDDFEGVWVLKSETRGAITSDIKLKGSVHIEAIGEITLNTPIKTYSDFVIKKGTVTINSLIECNVLILEENEAYNILVNNATIRKDHLIIRDNPNRKLKINGINLERVTSRDVTRDGELAKGEIYHFCSNTNAQLVLKTAKGADAPRPYVRVFVIWFDQNFVEQGTYTKIYPTSGSGAVDSVIVQSTHAHGTDSIIRSQWTVSYHNNADATDLPPAIYEIESSVNRHYLSENSVYTAYCDSITPAKIGKANGVIYMKKNGTAPLKYAIVGETNQDGVFEGLAAGTYKVTVTSDSSTCVKDTVIENIVVGEVELKNLTAVQLNASPRAVVNKPNTVSFVIFNEGTYLVTGTKYTVQLQDTVNTVLATANGVDLASEAQTSINLTWTPTTVGTIGIKGVIVYAEDQNPDDDFTTIVNVTIAHQYNLTLVANPSEGGTVNDSVNGNYYMGDSITVIATPADGYNFINWTKSGTEVSTTAQFDYIMPSENVTLTANFEEIPKYTVTFTVVDTANSPIQGATITINQQTLTTNASGVATIDLVNGTYAYTISKEGYVNVTDDAVVNGANVSINKTLNLIEYTVTFTVVDTATNPIQGAT
ncbi:MAG TPA: hypothetical protein PLS84_07520, partial [Salinivirgaceae bacterium]|nr:hypothetical protein [Salinivirgaceae bacterium]